MAEDPQIAATRKSWNTATERHNRHKGDQATWLRGGGDTLRAEEPGLRGDLAGLDLTGPGARQRAACRRAQAGAGGSGPRTRPRPASPMWPACKTRLPLLLGLAGRRP